MHFFFTIRKVKKFAVSILKLVAGLLGFEPRTTESKSVVLPLHYSPTDLAVR